MYYHYALSSSRVALHRTIKMQELKQQWHAYPPYLPLSAVNIITLCWDALFLRSSLWGIFIFWREDRLSLVEFFFRMWYKYSSVLKQGVIKVPVVSGLTLAGCQVPIKAVLSLPFSAGQEKKWMKISWDEIKSCIVSLTASSSGGRLLTFLPHSNLGFLPWEKSSMNYSNTTSPHRLQFFRNCSSIGLFHWVQSFRKKGPTEVPSMSQGLPAACSSEGSFHRCKGLPRACSSMGFHE